MRVASFEADGRATYGVHRGDMLQEAGAEFRSRYSDLRAVMSADALDELSADDTGARYDVRDVRFLPVLANPEKILCVGVNYRPHVEEMGRSIPDYPVVFVRFPGSLVGHGEALIRPKVSEQFDFEGELAIVIGKAARHVRRKNAFDVIAGYCAFMDGSVRDWQKHTMQFTAGKNFHRSGAMGPFLVTQDAVADVAALELTTTVNGELMQSGRISDLIFDIPALVEYCSTFAQLRPGDVIATGTPGGVGAARTPPRWLKPGDVVEVGISGFAPLQNPVRDEALEEPLRP